MQKLNRKKKKKGKKVKADEETDSSVCIIFAVFVFYTNIGSSLTPDRKRFKVASMYDRFCQPHRHAKNPNAYFGGTAAPPVNAAMADTPCASVAAGIRYKSARLLLVSLLPLLPPENVQRTLLPLTCLSLLLNGLALMLGSWLPLLRDQAA